MSGLTSRISNAAIAMLFFASVALGAILFITPVNAYSGSGAGTSGDPYVITTCAEFTEIDDEASAYYMLANDINCTSDGNSIMLDNTFTGSFDGGNFTIDIALNDTGNSDMGLFNTINGTISNLTVNGTLVTDSYKAGLVASSLVGSSAIATNVHSSGTVTSSSDNVGGLFGSVDCSSQVINSSSSADVSGGDAVGGLAGSGGCEGPGGSFSNSYATGDASGDNAVGGLIGGGIWVDIRNSYATGDVSGNGGDIGGLVGYWGSDTDGTRMIFQSYATGDVTNTGTGAKVGGFIGDHDGGVISQSYATGDVSGDQASDTGGFVGDGDGLIYNAFARGNVSVAAGADDVGGFGGDIDDDGGFYNTYSTGTVTMIATDNGAHTGGSGALVYASFWDTQTSGETAGCGGSTVACFAVGKSTAQMKTESTFTSEGWDFDTIWGLNAAENDGYPYFIGGTHEVIEPVFEHPTETILTENLFRGGGVAQGFNEDDDYFDYDLPFSFQFYNGEYTTVFVDSNGYIGFSDDDDMGEYDFDFEDFDGVPAIVALNGDLDLDCGSDDNPGEDIYITDAGDGVVIFRWDVADHDTCENIYNFEIALYEDGRFSVSYGDMGTIDPDEIEGEIGISNGIGGYKLSQYDGETNLANVGTAGWNWDDNDGVSSDVEAAAPNDGDANNDGTPDAQQERVTSTISPVSNAYVVLEAGGVCSENESVLVEQETTVVNKDDDVYDYPAGLLDFSLSGCSVGGTETIVQYYYGNFDLSSVVLRKYDKSNDTYADIPDAVLSQVTIGGESAIRAEYTVTDGGDLDADGLVNGVIVDPVGLGQVAAVAVTAPNTGLKPTSSMLYVLALISGSVVLISAAYRSKEQTQKSLEGEKTL